MPARELELLLRVGVAEVAAHGLFRGVGALAPGDERALRCARDEQLRMSAGRGPERAPARVVDHSGEVLADFAGRKRAPEAREKSPHRLRRLRCGELPEAVRI